MDKQAKIKAVMEAAAVTPEVARQYLEAEEWLVDEAVFDIRTERAMELKTSTGDRAEDDEWQEFSHAGKRWSFNGDELAEWDDEDGGFHFLAYHQLAKPSVQALCALIDTL